MHGGFDGYCRLPVYLKVSPNNRADTVLTAFLEAVSQYGLPSRVRADCGRENAGICLHTQNKVHTEEVSSLAEVYTIKE